MTTSKKKKKAELGLGQFGQLGLTSDISIAPETSLGINAITTDLVGDRPVQLLAFWNGTPIDVHVPQLTREKIWSGKYVDLVPLYRDNAARALTASAKGSELFLAVEQSHMVFLPATTHLRKLDSIDQWLSAFHVFMAIYTVRHPIHIFELLKYAEIVWAIPWPWLAKL